MWGFAIDGYYKEWGPGFRPRIYTEEILGLRNFRPKKRTEVCERTFTWEDSYNCEFNKVEALICVMGHEPVSNGTLILGKPVGNRVPVSIEGESEEGNGIYKVKAAAMAEYKGVLFLDREDHAYTTEEVVLRRGPQFDLSEYDRVSDWNEVGLFYWTRLIPKATSKEYRHEFEELRQMDGT